MGPPEALVVNNARAKRDEVARGLTGACLVVGADTVVVLEGRALGKPADLAEAALASFP